MVARLFLSCVVFAMFREFASAKCPKSTRIHEYVRGRCVYVSQNVLKKSDAENMCRELDTILKSGHRWHLPKLDTVEKSNKMAATIRKFQSGPAWIGLVRDFAANDGKDLPVDQWNDYSKWRWSADNTTLASSYDSSSSKAPWNNGEPNNYGPKPEYCVVLSRRWFDYPCDLASIGVCEANAIATTTTIPTTTATTITTTTTTAATTTTTTTTTPSTTTTTSPSTTTTTSPSTTTTTTPTTTEKTTTTSTEKSTTTPTSTTTTTRPAATKEASTATAPTSQQSATNKIKTQDLVTSKSSTFPYEVIYVSAVLALLCVAFMIGVWFYRRRKKKKQSNLLWLRSTRTEAESNLSVISNVSSIREPEAKISELSASSDNMGISKPESSRANGSKNGSKSSLGKTCVIKKTPAGK